MLLPGDANHYLMSHVAFADALVVCSTNGLDQIQIISGDDNHTIEFPEPAYSVDLDTNPNYRTSTLRLAYTSMVTPQTVLEYDWQTKALTSLKVQEIPGGYETSDYVSERLQVICDGTHVPMSLVRHKDTLVNGTAPVYLYGYGAYGHAIPPSFSSNVISLLDRGFSPSPMFVAVMTLVTTGIPLANCKSALTRLMTLLIAPNI